jgi:hypothetical protein
MCGMDSYMHLIISEHADFEHDLRSNCTTRRGFDPGKVARSARTARACKRLADPANATNATSRVTKATLG